MFKRIFDKKSVEKNTGKSGEYLFWIYLLALAGVAYFLLPFPVVAMWFGFTIAGYSAVANDSIQTIGTFIASNKDKKWWVLWLFIGLIYLATIAFSFFANKGDVSFGRLLSVSDKDGSMLFPEISKFNFLQIAAPIVLLALTRLRMPVSTTFMLLSTFSSTPEAIGAVLFKSMSGYLVAITVGVLVWTLFSKIFKKYFKGEAPFYWTVLQWISSGSLWAVWIMQDMANVVIFLPRRLSIIEFIIVGILVFIGIGLLFYTRGARIQKIVDEKTDVTDVRPATIIDFVYALILFIFQYLSSIPMSTTWVFLGLLAGREIGYLITDQPNDGQKVKRVFTMIGRDLLFALIGLAVSLLLATLANPKLLEGFIN